VLNLDQERERYIAIIVAMKILQVIALADF
jgi:hypothetical protein